MFFNMLSRNSNKRVCVMLFLSCFCAIATNCSAELIVDRNYITALTRTPHLLSEPITTFTKNVYHALSEDPGNKATNIIASPLSIHSALSMLYYGSPKNSSTNSELASVLALDVNPSSFQNSKYHFLSLFRYYKRSGKLHNAVVNFANRIYLQQGFNAKKRFINLLKSYFFTSADVVDFADSFDAAGRINQFVNEKTNGLISKIITPDNIDALTRLVLINAIYFKAGWKYQFDPEDTLEMQFTLLDGTNIKHEKGMVGEANLRYGRSTKLNASILELPYTNPDLNMYIMMPENNDLESLDTLATTFDIHDIQNNLKYSTDGNLNVLLPAFKSSFQANMNEVLQKLGAASMFHEGDADFSLISKEDLFVGDVLHKAMINVDEKGSEAAAATGIGIGVRGYPNEQSQYFRVNRPFIYAIYDSRNEMPLFIGRMLNPSTNE